MTTRALLSVLLLAGLGAGCSGDDGPTPEGMSLRERIQTETQLSLENDPDGVTVHSVIELGTTQNDLDVVFGVSSGTMSVQSDAAGNILLTEIDADLSDIVISDTAFPPDGLTITNIHAVLDAPMPASGAGEWTFGDNRVTATVTADLLLDWAVAQDMADPLPLAQQRITAVDFTIDAQQDDIGAITVAVTGIRMGDFFTWSDLVTLSDLSVLLNGTLPVR